MTSESAAGGSPPAEVRHIVLVGLMGSGKTTIGRLLAERLGWRQRDNDAGLAAMTGETARELNERLGVSALHRLEAADLLAALQETDRTVISAASSVIEDPTCREALQAPGIVVVWLRADPAILAERIRTMSHRPELAADVANLLERQRVTRDPLYASVADIAVEAGDRPPETIVEEIVHALPA